MRCGDIVVCWYLVERCEGAERLWRKATDAECICVLELAAQAVNTKSNSRDESTIKVN